MTPPGSTLGLLGGGQLGRMFTMAAQSMGYQVMVVDPGDHSPAGSVADFHLRADYLDPEALDRLARECRAVTTEFENVPAEALARLSVDCLVSPGAHAVSIAQDRIREKQFIVSLGIPVAPHLVARTAADLKRAAPELLPGILKRSRFGYDGKGQARVKDAEEARAAFAAMGSEPCVLEALLPLEREVSVVVVRAFDGATAAYPVAENWHARGILDVSIIPARVPPSLAEEARREALAIAEGLDYRGVLCVEFFVVGDGRLLVNEIAPRPHNSGHYTIDACVTSQFEQQARVMARLPLGSTAMHCAAVMVNVLGDSWAAGEPDWAKVLAHPRAKLHLYGKKEARPGRKMGHFTLLGDSVPAALAEAMEIRGALTPAAEPIPAWAEPI